jgi:hypothetical protein
MVENEVRHGSVPLWRNFGIRSFHGGGEFMRAEEEAGAERGIGGEVRRMRAWYC